MRIRNSARGCRCSSAHWDQTIETGGSSTPKGYNEFIADLKQRVRTTQFRAVRAANTEVLRLYWSVGRDILDRQKNAGWGAKVVDQISVDMRRAFPGQRGWSRSNVKNMRRFAEGWPASDTIGQQAVGQLPWGHIVTLIERLRVVEDRDWYASKAVENGWSRASLEFEIKMDLKSRLGSAASNFSTTLDAADSNLAQQAVKDSYVFEHLDPVEHIAERDRERALMERIERTLMEFGRGLAFVGRQVRFDVGGDEFFIDLLLFQGHAKTVGILLCADRNEETVSLSLASAASPVAVALYDGLTPEERAALPDPEELEAVIEQELQAHESLIESAPDPVEV